MPLNIGEAFGVRLSFLALFDAVVCLWARINITPHCKAKAAEKTAALHDAGAKSADPSRLAKLLECACLFWRFEFGRLISRMR